MQIEWHDGNSVGVPSLDKQHKRLILLTNDLFEAIIAGESQSTVKTILEKIAEYVAYHFSYEEHLLTKHGYPVDELNRHIAEHRKLTTQVYEFMVKFNAQETTVDLELFDFLREWTGEHLNGTDKKYAQFLQSKGVD